MTCCGEEEQEHLEVGETPPGRAWGRLTLPPALNQHRSYLGKEDPRLSETIMLMLLSPVG